MSVSAFISFASTAAAAELESSSTLYCGISFCVSFLSPFVPERVIEVCIQLLTIVALCALAVSAGVIVGSVMTRTTLTPGMLLLSVSPYGSSPPLQFIQLDITGGPPPVPTNTTAVFRAQFTVTMPLRSTGVSPFCLSLCLLSVSLCVSFLSLFVSPFSLSLSLLSVSLCVSCLSLTHCLSVALSLAVSFSLSHCLAPFLSLPLSVSPTQHIQRFPFASLCLSLSIFSCSPGSVSFCFLVSPFSLRCLH